jgi:hypothetical protein
MTERFMASRWTSGNRIFRDIVGVEPDGIHYVKHRLFGSSEETINFRQISSIRVETGMLFATITIESSGGSQPVTIHGLWKKDAKRVRELVQRVQAEQAEKADR